MALRQAWDLQLLRWFDLCRATVCWVACWAVGGSHSAPAQVLRQSSALKTEFETKGSNSSGNPTLCV